MTSPSWTRFIEWNDAIAEVCFPELEHPQPAYLDLDEETIAPISEILGINPDDFSNKLGGVVREAMTFSQGKANIFRPIVRQVHAWRRARRSIDPPPVLPLLAALSLAAKHMASGDGVSSANYYQRFVSLLGLEDRKTDIAATYRAHALELWGALNSWLESLDGARGTPTARAIGNHAYVGIPLSQALIRRADRQRMTRFFSEAGLPSGANIERDELGRLFTHWLSTAMYSSATLKRLWQDAKHKERVLDALEAALQEWDGHADRSTDEADSAQLLKLTLSLSTFPRKALMLSALVYFDAATTPRSALLTSGEVEAEIDLIPAIPGALTIGQGIQNQDLLESEVSIVDSVTSQTVSRSPSRLVVFRKDPNTAVWRETNGILLGEELRLVCRADLVPALEQVLEQAARPGFQKLDPATRGLMDDWVVYTGIEILRDVIDLIPGRSSELGQLDPIVETQLQLSGGLRLPRMRSTWHSALLPELKVLMPDAPGFVVTLMDETDEPHWTIGSWADDDSGYAVINLAELELEVGDYRAVVTSSDGTSRTNQHFSIRDSSIIAAPEELAEVVHAVHEPLQVLGVPPESTEEIFEHESLTADAAMNPEPWWRIDLRPSLTDKPHIALSPLAPDSCVFTGAHHWHIEQAMTGRWGKPMESAGKCRKCGLQQTFGNNYYKNRRKFLRGKRDKPKSRPRVHTVPEGTSSKTSIPWDAVADALMTMESGTWSDFQSLVRQIDDQGPTVFHVAHTLEAVGLIEIFRDENSLDPIVWETMAPFATVNADGSMTLRGAWTRGTLETAARAWGRYPDVSNGHHNGGPDSGPANLLLTDAEDFDFPCTSWEELALQLPYMNEIIQALPRRTTATYLGQFRAFHVPSASWVPVTDINQVGAYRLRSYGTHDLLRTEEDLEAGTVAASQVRFGKHAAAYLIAARPLVAYTRATEELTVPLGADLPGLYNRVVVLASGTLPMRRGSNMVYSGVPAELASHLSYLMSN